MSLSGTWTTSNGSTTTGNYYIREVTIGAENVILWHGEPPKDDDTWGNVAYGTVSGNQIKVTWADLPNVQNQGSGTFNLEISNDGKTLTKSDARGSGFGASVFTKS